MNSTDDYGTDVDIASTTSSPAPDTLLPHNEFLEVCYHFSFVFLNVRFTIWI